MPSFSACLQTCKWKEKRRGRTLSEQMKVNFETSKKTLRAPCHDHVLQTTAGHLSCTAMFPAIQSISSQMSLKSQLNALPWKIPHGSGRTGTNQWIVNIEKHGAWFKQKSHLPLIPRHTFSTLAFYIERLHYHKWSPFVVILSSIQLRQATCIYAYTFIEQNEPSKLYLEIFY